MASYERMLDGNAYKKQIDTNAILGWKPGDILNANREQLLTMQYRLGLGSTWGVIEIPGAYMPKGILQHSSMRIHRLAQFLPNGIALDDPRALQTWTEVMRFAVSRLTIFGPRRAVISGYTTCSQDLHLMKAVTRKILIKPAVNGYFWSLVREDEFTKSQARDTLFSMIRHFHTMGCHHDSLSRIEPIKEDETERDRKDEPEVQAPVDTNKQWQPLPLDFVAEAGWRAVQIVQSVAPTLLDAIEAALQFRVTHGRAGKRLGPSRSKLLTTSARDKVIADWDWRDEKAESLRTLKFPFHQKTQANGKGKKYIYEDLTWPPRTYAQAMTFAHAMVKPAHLWMVLLGNGNRNSEAVSMTTTCLTPEPNGNFTWKGQTFKMTGLTGGHEVKVVVPELIGQSILQQIRLCELTRRAKGWNGDALWIGDTSEELRNLSQVLNSYVDFLGLRHLLGDDNPSCHEHRFRKTLARLVALALTNSIMILKDCFGHTDAVMTLLSYIESDPTIAMEVIKVQKELTIMMAVEVIDDREIAGGPGAQALRERADEHLKRIGKSKFDPQDAYEFARSETFDGRSWMLVAPGVICTAPHDITQVSTPCAVGQKHHNPANCRTGCDWQILLKGFQKTQADDTVEYALKNLERAIDEEDEAGIAMWKGQAKTWLYRYDEVANKWKDHPIVMAHVPRPLRVTIREAA